VRLFSDGSRLLHVYFQRTGQSARLRELHARLDQFEKTYAESQEETRTVTAADMIIPHGLSDEELAALRQVLSNEPEILAAQLGQKQLRHSASQRLYLLCIQVRRAWYFLSSQDRATACINRL